MLELLKELKITQEFVSIYTNINNPTSFHFGKIISINEYETAIEMLAPNGKYDGVLVISTDLIYRIEKDGSYSKKMNKLYSINEPLPTICLNNNDIKRDVLLLSIKNCKIVSIELENSGIYDVVGLVNSINNTTCCIDIIDEYGIKDGEAYFTLNSITKICYDSQDEQILSELIK